MPISCVRFWQRTFVRVEFIRPSVYVGNYYDIGATCCMPRGTARVYLRGGAAREVGRG